MEAVLGNGTALIGQLLMGVSLAACAGLRAFLPLFVVGLAGRFDWIPLTPFFDWLASTPALVVFGVAVVLELLADKIPLVDNVLDAAETLVKPIAGAILVASVVAELSPLQGTVLGIVAGGTAAGVMHLSKAKVRLVSSSTTAGFANPLISLAEDAVALLATIGSLIVPVLVLAFLFGSAVLIWLFLRRLVRVLRGSPSGDGLNQSAP